MITNEFGVRTIFHGYATASILGTPCGRQCASGSSLECAPFFRASKSALAQGLYGTSSCFMSAARSRRNLLSVDRQMPVRSGLPSGRRGVGARGADWPPAVCGGAAGGTFTHCAVAGVAATSSAPAMDRACRADQVGMANLSRDRDACRPRSVLQQLNLLGRLGTRAD